MSASSSILRGKRKIRRCKRKPAGVNDISRLLLWSGKTKSPAYFRTLSIFGGRGWITQAAHLKRPRRGLFAAGTYSGGRCCSNPPLRRFTNFQRKQKLQCHYNTGVLGGRGWITQAALLKTAHWAVFALSSATAPQLFESTLGYALKSFGQKKNSSIFTTLEFLVERSNPNPNNCNLGHLWRRFHRK